MIEGIREIGKKDADADSHNSYFTLTGNPFVDGGTKSQK